MSELTFSQPARSNLILPILIAVVVLGVGGGLLFHFMPHKTADLAITQTQVYPIHVEYKRQQAGGFKVLDNSSTSEDDLYVVPTLRIEDKLGMPLYIKDFTATLNTASGEIHTSAIEKTDLDTVFAAYPAVKPLVGTPLLRETAIAPDKPTEGTLLLQFPITKAAWDGRQSASITIDFYHQPSLTVAIPKP